jgi:hypothetical protein
MKKRGYVVAVSQKEADELARDCPELIHAEPARPEGLDVEWLKSLPISIGVCRCNHCCFMRYPKLWACSP